jgi:6-phosphogluconolactonase (cycloisomerase 2 family)
MAIIQISKIQHRAGNLVDLPQLDDAEFGWASDVNRLFIGKSAPNENIEVLTSYSNITFTQLNGASGVNLNLVDTQDGQLLGITKVGDTSTIVNKGGTAGGNINLGDVANIKIGGAQAQGYVLETDGYGNLSFTPKGTLYTPIRALSNATPIIMTVANTIPYTNGAIVTITNSDGANANTIVNGRAFYITLSVDFANSGNVALYTDLARTIPAAGTNLGASSPNVAVATAIISGTGSTTSLSASGANTQIQFNYTNVLRGDSRFTYNSDTNQLNVTGNAAVGNLQAAGTVSAPRLISSVPSGTAPITVTSNTLVPNLYVARSVVSDTTTITATSSGTSYLMLANATSGDVVGYGNANLSFDAATGNLVSTLLSATSTVQGSTLVSTVAIGNAPLVVTSTTKVANLNADLLDGYNTSITATANTVAIRDANGNVSSNYFIGNGSQLTGITSIQSGTSNVQVVANGNVTFGVTGTSNVMVVANTSVNITGTLAVSGNANVGNIGANNGAFTNVSGNGAGLAGILGSNVTGQVGNALVASTVYTNAQPNITSVGTLTGLTVGNTTANTVFGNGTISATGNANVGNIGTAGLIVATGNVTGGNLVTGGVASVTGNVTGGNLITSGYVSAGQTITTDRFLQTPYSVVAPAPRLKPGTGNLSVITTAIASGTNPTDVAVDPTGRFVYVTNTNTNNISQYSINQTTGVLTSITTAIASGASPSGVAVDPTGRFVYVINQGANNVSQYSINQTTGALTEITTAIAAGTYPSGVAVDPTGRFVYVTNYSASSISQYSINQTTGALTQITTAIASGAGPIGITVDPTGRFVYVTNNSANTISLFTVNETTGALTSITTSISAGAGALPNRITVDPTGTYLYVSNFGTGTLGQYIVNQSTGNLSIVSTTIASGLSTIGIAVDPTGRFVYVINQGANNVSQFSINNFSTSQGTILNLTTIGISTGASPIPGTITGNWSLSDGSQLRATYADLAEYYEADYDYSPGTVLEFGGEKEVTLAQDGTTRVAGVVSTNPAYVMNATCPGIAVAVALQGRVPCKVRGVVRKGDMMVSAGNGFARPWNNPQMGMVIGKALEDFDGIEGVIEVAVGRL